MSHATTFSPNIYEARRTALLARMANSGLILLPGNQDASMNYLHNIYPFRQDSSFAYYFGLHMPDLVGVLDTDNGTCTLYGDDPSLESIVWTGPLPTLAERGQTVGITQTASLASLPEELKAAQNAGRRIHYLPPYRGKSALQLATLLNLAVTEIARGESVDLIRAIVAQREVKSEEEIAEMTWALGITKQMHETAMRETRPGQYEYQIVGAMEGLMRRHGLQLAYPSIFSKQGEVLHNGSHHNQLQAGDWVVNDTGCSSRLGYASDITRTLPVSGQFTDRQRTLYQITLDSQLAAIAAMKPGVTNLSVHQLAVSKLVDGLKALGIFTGDTEETVLSGAYAIIFQCGLGHQIGMDVHDMENLGEAYVGYDEATTRSTLFGMRNLRMGKAYRQGMVMTVEPGLYFIPAQIDQWQAEKRHAHLINYEVLNQYRDAGGVRIEDEVLITENSCEVIGEPIPKSIAEVEALMGTAA
ncbi:aminopeptidase P family protein [Leeia sp. TBRC 13508]|uniref:Xaa-Pro aminopeptidase n=1 Tax=Leeia speluncae TaxID=2884804 RepID=A0ABS8D597_9NEIS|nr:aminopeptidase P family protein [Leeia speluncae]MCB6183368.1 aminopeptidase P family protein [Leeia speluncae]